MSKQLLLYDSKWIQKSVGQVFEEILNKKNYGLNRVKNNK